MNPNAEKWVAALESGEYTQTTGRLRDGYGFCCLGVACDVAIKEGVSLRVDEDEDAECILYDDTGGTLPDRVMRWLGMGNSFGGYGHDRALADDNDDGATFAEIAQTIRSHPELFVDEEAA